MQVDPLKTRCRSWLRYTFEKLQQERLAHSLVALVQKRAEGHMIIGVGEST